MLKYILFTYVISCKGLYRQWYLLDSDIHLASYKHHLFGWDNQDTGYIDCNPLPSNRCCTRTCAQIHQYLYKCHERMGYWNFWNLEILKIHFFFSFLSNTIHVSFCYGSFLLIITCKLAHRTKFLPMYLHIDKYGVYLHTSRAYILVEPRTDRNCFRPNHENNWVKK